MHRPTNAYSMALGAVVAVWLAGCSGMPTGGAGGAGGAGGTGGTGGSVGQDLNQNGPHQYRTFTVPKGVNFGGATVYYPTDGGPFGYVTFCPPYTATQSAFAAWGPFYASHGIVLATMDSVTTGDFPPQRAQGLEELMGILKNENTKGGSPLLGKLDTNRGGVIGWSMGGGAVWIASGKHPEWKTAITLAGHNATATGWDASARVSTVPTLMLNGATDTSILGGQGQTENAYALIPATTPKEMYIMSDLGHFDWGTPAAENNAAGRYVMAWEKVFLENDSSYRSVLTTKGPNASTFQNNL
jgi:pimeloyl-ACP methyl ester carboxylesterase